jgi:hypothetical protein
MVYKARQAYFGYWSFFWVYKPAIGADVWQLLCMHDQAEQQGASTSATPVSSRATPGVAPLAENASEAARGIITRRRARQMVKLACGCIGTCTCAAIA